MVCVRGLSGISCGGSSAEYSTYCDPMTLPRGHVMTRAPLFHSNVVTFLSLKVEAC